MSILTLQATADPADPAVAEPNGIVSATVRMINQPKAQQKRTNGESVAMAAT